MKEDFLHYLWKYRLFQLPLLTTDNEPVEVIKTGIHNSNSGPDFIDARLKIGGTIWAGNVEMHLQSSSWFEHRHHRDGAYDNVILHVVLHNDKPAEQSNGQSIPTLECHNRIPESIFEKYQGLMASKLWIPCARIISHCPDIVISSWLETQLIERLANKAQAVEQVWLNCDNDWEEIFYRLLARAFGLKINSLPFEMLAASLPFKIIAKHLDQAVQVDALIFGQAGFLDNTLNDDYPARLKNEYVFLKNKYNLQGISQQTWKFMRLRPGAFPTIRLGLFSSLLQQTNSLFSFITETADTEKMKALFKVRAHDYWNTHYRFDVESEQESIKTLGESAIDLIMINAVAPILFFYGRHYGNEDFIDRAIHLLESIAPEQNSIITNWTKLGIEVKDAFASQALINLKNNYCSRKRCLECRIGSELLK
jgi:hypothetical protein